MATTKHLTLVADTVSTVELAAPDPRADLTSFEDPPARRVEVLNRSGDAAVYFTTDGTAPTVGGDNTHVLPAAVSAVEVDDETPGPTCVVKLISAGTPAVSVRVL